MVASKKFSDQFPKDEAIGLRKQFSLMPKFVTRCQAVSKNIFDTFHSEAAEATWGIFFSIFFSLDQKSALQDHPKNNYLILNSKFKPHKLFKVSSFAFVHPVSIHYSKFFCCLELRLHNIRGKSVGREEKW